METNLGIASEIKTIDAENSAPNFEGSHVDKKEFVQLARK
jgi:hypothetical protein